MRSAYIELYKDDVAKKGPGTLCQFFTDQKRSDRLISSLKRFMVPNVGYPWSRDPNFRIDDLPYKPKKGNHILVRSNKYSSEFNKLNKQTKTELLRQRDRILSSSLPVPILTEKPLHLQNSIHSKAESDQPQMPSKFKKYWANRLVMLVLGQPLAYLAPSRNYLCKECAKYVNVHLRTLVTFLK